MPGSAPLSLQTLGVMLAGGFFGPKLGALSQALYLALGALGLPVFSGGSSDLAGAGVGYLVTFPLLAHLAGHAQSRSGIKRLTLLFVATIPTLVIGAGWLAYKRDVPFSSGILQYLPGNVLKVAASALILHRK
jgi:biotin transport system substrate-specific component